MRITICFLVYAIIEIYYQQCHGLNFIDLPGFGSDEQAEDVMSILKNNGTPPPSNPPTDNQEGLDSLWSGTDSDKKEQNKEQSLNRRQLDYPQSTGQSSSSAVTEASTTKISTNNQPEQTRRYPPVKPSTLVTVPNYRRHWLVSATEPYDPTASPYLDDKDENIKSKISMLVSQTMHDTEIRMKTVQKLKEKHRDEAPYRVGFILSMIKKSRDVLNELFNVAVKHRDEWKALEQLKIFELIVHTNVDTTNLVRQLVEIHIQNLNATAHTTSTTTTTENTPGRVGRADFNTKRKIMLL